MPHGVDRRHRRHSSDMYMMALERQNSEFVVDSLRSFSNADCLRRWRLLANSEKVVNFCVIILLLRYEVTFHLSTILFRPVSSSALLYQIITFKLENGNIKAAVRILNSDEKPSAPSEQMWSKLKITSSSIQTVGRSSLSSAVRQHFGVGVGCAPGCSFPASSAGKPR